MGRSYDTGIDVRTCAYIRRHVLAPVNNAAARGRGQVTAFVQKFKFGSSGTVSIPHTSSVACHMPRSSKSDIKILYSATVREILFFYPSKSIVIIPLLFRAISPGSESGSDSNADSTQSSFELRDELRSMR
jgi:hypothetical protein